MEVFYSQNSRKAKKSFGGVELLEYVWRLFSGNGVWGGSRQKGRLPGDPSENPHFVNKDGFFSIRAAENN